MSVLFTQFENTHIEKQVGQLIIALGPNVIFIIPVPSIDDIYTYKYI